MAEGVRVCVCACRLALFSARGGGQRKGRCASRCVVLVVSHEPFARAGDLFLCQALGSAGQAKLVLGELNGIGEGRTDGRRDGGSDRHRAKQQSRQNGDNKLRVGRPVCVGTGLVAGKAEPDGYMTWADEDGRVRESGRYTTEDGRLRRYAVPVSLERALGGTGSRE